jgi:hypothetical protein
MGVVFTQRVDYSSSNRGNRDSDDNDEQFDDFDGIKF